MSVRPTLRKLRFPLLVACVFVGMSVLVFWMYQSVQELRSQGKPATSVIAPVAGAPGKSAYDIAKENGFKGSETDWLASLSVVVAAPLSQAGIQAAVNNYCQNGSCDGRNPTPQQVVAAIAQYCSTGACKGQDGRDAPGVSDGQVSAAVAAYCSDGRCVGAKGDSVTGANGTNGRTPVIQCVDRSNQSYVAWKYDDEPDTAFRDLYRIPPTSSCTDPITLG